MIKRKYTSTFVPIISSTEYDDYAAEFLRKYGYAEAITTPMPIPIWDIAKKISLAVHFARLSQNGEDISGLIALADGIVDLYDDTDESYIGARVKKGTVLLEVSCLVKGRHNNSLAHECVHWWLHRLYFTNKGGGEAFGFRCPRRVDFSSEGERSEQEWMELQARGIAGRILMPKVAAKTKITEFLAQHGLAAETATEEQFKAIAKTLAEFFQVSHEAALVRLSQFGYIEYTPQSRQPSKAACAVERQRVIQERQPMVGQRTLRLGTQEFLQEYSRNEALRGILAKGQFLFVDGYIVINDPKYITHTNDAARNLTLTKYAQEHIDECTLGFIYRRQNKGAPQTISEIFYRRQDEEDFPTTEAAYISDNANSAVLSKAVHLSKRQTEFGQEFATFQMQKKAYSLGEAIDIILKAKDIRVNEAAHLAGLATSQVTRLKSDSHKHGLKILTQFCAGLALEPYISRDLITKAGISLDNPKEEDFAYMIIIDTMSGNGITEINKYLVSIGLEPFHITQGN